VGHRDAHAGPGTRHDVDPARNAEIRTPAVLIAGADEITRDHLEALAGACERRGVPLTLLFRHLRDDATALIGGATATAFMRLGNHHEAEQAATFIGRQHTFTVSGWTATQGGEHSTASTSGYSHGASQSRGTSTTAGWSSDGLRDQTSSGGSTRTRDRGQSQDWSQSDTSSDGTSWSTARSSQRVYEYAVEPTVLQNLADNALLFPARSAASSSLLAVESDPRIVTLPAAARPRAADNPAITRPPTPEGWPELAAPRRQPASELWRRSPTPTPTYPARPRTRPRETHLGPISAPANRINCRKTPS
jgi:hypothetical protein